MVTRGLIDGTLALIRTLMQPWPAAVRQIPLATGASVLRLIAAYAISLAWTVPCAIAASESQHFARRLAPFAEIVGSMPATALFPLIVIFVIRVTGGMNLASILLILTGMQWYVLFNLLAGVSQIPADLKEAVALVRPEPLRHLAQAHPAGHPAVADHRQHHCLGRRLERADPVRILRLSRHHLQSLRPGRDAR